MLFANFLESCNDLNQGYFMEKIYTLKFLYSKLQVTQLLDILENKLLKKDKRNQIVEDLYLYASSQSKYSSAYYKLE